jgi:hypothetical protein
MVAIIGGASFAHAFSAADGGSTWATWGGTAVALTLGVASLPVSNAVVRRASNSERQLAIIYAVTFLATSIGVALIAIGVGWLLVDF